MAWVLGTVVLNAAEVDHFSTLNAPLADSRQLINQLFNERMAQVLAEMDEGCDERKLYHKLRWRTFNNVHFSAWVKDVAFGDKVAKIFTPLEESVYRDFWQINIGDKITQFRLAAVLRIGDVRLGSDKLSHFFGSGYLYFKSHYIKENPLAEVLGRGQRNEYGILGSWVSGVISYADMLANFSGMRFWNHLLQKHPDVLGQNLGPYLQCRGESWVQIKAVDLGEYMDHGFDESINCSRFMSNDQLLSFRRLLGGITCPHGRPEVISNLRLKYGRLAPYLLNFHGHNSLRDTQYEGAYPSPSEMVD